jgi:hypothetical protein
VSLSDDLADEVFAEMDLLADALRAVVAANDTREGALGTIRDRAGKEAAEVAARYLPE